MRTLILIFLLSLFTWSSALETTLIDFELQDQFDSTFNQNSFDGKIVIIIGADRQGSKYTDQWGQALGDSLRTRNIDNVQFVALATLTGVPGMMKGMVKGFFPKEKENWVLMDWQGVFADAFDFSAKKCNILVFDKEKKLLVNEPVTDFDKATAAAILEFLVFD